jgi:DNA-binding IclR family transcriptional regulator
MCAIEVEELARAVSVRPAATGDLPLASSATGRAYAAFMPEDRYRPLIAAEPPQRKRAAYLGQLTEVRRRGIARNLGERYPGLDSFSAPIFGADGGVVLAVTAFGLAVNFPGAWDSGAAKALRDCAVELTRRIGGRPRGRA